MSSILDKLKKQIEKEVGEKVVTITGILERIEKIQEEQLKLLKDIKKLLEKCHE